MRYQHVPLWMTRQLLDAWRVGDTEMLAVCVVLKLAHDAPAARRASCVTRQLHDAWARVLTVAGLCRTGPWVGQAAPTVNIYSLSGSISYTSIGLDKLYKYRTR